MSIVKGTFKSVWEEGEVETEAIFDSETSEITAKSVDGEGMENLLFEIFIDTEENEYPVCPNCHGYILTSKMIPDEFKNLVEVDHCPECGAV